MISKDKHLQSLHYTHSLPQKFDAVKSSVIITENISGEIKESTLVAHDCGYPLSCYTCRATRVAADFLDFIAFCRCSSGVAPHPLKILVSHLSPPPFPGGVAPKFGSEKVSRYTGVSRVQLRVSRYTVQLRNLPSPQRPSSRK